MERDNDKKKTDYKEDSRNLSAKKQAEYVRFMFVTITVGVILCIAVFFIVFYTMNKGKSNTTNQTMSQTEGLTTQESNVSGSGTQENLELLAVVLSVNKDNKKIKLYDFEEDNEISLVMSAGADMQNQYGQLMTLAEFTAGDIVQVIYDTKSMEYSSLKISSKSWTQKSIKDLKVNVKSSSITSGNKVYNYNSKLVSKYNDTDFDIALLDEMDIVTIKGYDNTIWSINVEKGHGLVSIINKDKILEGSIEIDTNIFRQLSENEKIKLSEGEHKLVVKGSNIESYTKQFSVENGEELNIDLSDIQIKSGVLIVKANVSDYMLYVNDEEQVSGEPIVLEYGNYTIKAVKEEYNDLTTTVIVDKPTVTLELSMEKIEKILMGELKVNTIPIEGVNVYVDNVYVGVTPLKIKLEYGEHRVSVIKEGYTDIGVPVTINEQTPDININMIKSTEPPTLPVSETTSTDSSGVDVKPIY